MILPSTRPLSRCLSLILGRAHVLLTALSKCRQMCPVIRSSQATLLVRAQDAENLSIYVYSDDCAQGTIDPNFGVFTVPAFTTPPEENCTITVTDTTNTDINTGDPVVCTLDINILAGTCECEGNFDNDQDVDGFDAAIFKSDFGRGEFTRPCVDGDFCNGDFSCDGDVDGTDAAIFKQDFGRSGLINPCPACPRDPWCVY